MVRAEGGSRVPLPVWLLAVTTITCGGHGISIPSGGASAAPPSLNVYATQGTERTSGPGGIHCPQWLSLNPDRSSLSYTSRELGLMGDYVVQGRHGDPPAPLLQNLPGGLVDDSVLSRPLFTLYSDTACSVNLQITNTGHTTVQITQAGFAITSPPQPNTTQYRLPEICSLEEASEGVPAGTLGFCGGPRGGGPSDCSVYVAVVTLTGSTQGSMPMVAPDGKQSEGSACPQITLNPGHSIEIWLHGSASTAYVYQVQPALNVTWPGGTITMTFPRIAGVMPFAAAAQFSCYRLHGLVFQQAWHGVDALDFGSRSKDGALCL